MGVLISASPATEAGTDGAALLLILCDLVPVVVSAGHIPHALDLLAVEDHHPLATLLGEEDGLAGVVDLVDDGIWSGAKEGEKVLKGHRHRLSRASEARGNLPPTPVM